MQFQPPICGKAWDLERGHGNLTPYRPRREMSAPSHGGAALGYTVAVNKTSASLHGPMSTLHEGPPQNAGSLVYSNVSAERAIHPVAEVKTVKEAYSDENTALSEKRRSVVNTINDFEKLKTRNALPEQLKYYQQKDYGLQKHLPDSWRSFDLPGILACLLTSTTGATMAMMSLMQLFCLQHADASLPPNKTMSETNWPVSLKTISTVLCGISFTSGLCSWFTGALNILVYSKLVKNSMHSSSRYLRQGATFRLMSNFCLFFSFPLLLTAVIISMQPISVLFTTHMNSVTIGSVLTACAITATCFCIILGVHAIYASLSFNDDRNYLDSEQMKDCAMKPNQQESCNPPTTVAITAMAKTPWNNGQKNLSTLV